MIGVSLVVLWSAVFAATAAAQDSPSSTFSKYVDPKGGISLPPDFETRFVHLGTIAVAPKAGADVTELHSTYTRAVDLQAFLREGHFSDGAVLVKEVDSAQGQDLTTGHARFPLRVKIWFVMVKDSKNRFPTNALWGDGWGWALFKGSERTKQVATDYRVDCRTCHVPVRGQDWVYTQCYPRLRKGSPELMKGTSSTEDTPKADLVSRFPQWKSALRLKGDAEKGRKYFESKVINTSLTCASCHSFDPRDTMRVDGDGLLRAGFPIFASLHRTNIKQSGTGLAALGANVCVVHFMKAPVPGMTAQELADMDAFLHTGGGPKHDTAKNVDYPHRKWTIPEELSNGDASRGEKVALQSCITCHSVGAKPARVLDAGGQLQAGAYTKADLRSLARRIRNPEFKVNLEMPGYSDLRLSTGSMIDVLAWLTTK